MNNKVDLIEIGSSVKINLGMVQDQIPLTLTEKLRTDSTGKVMGYKMTDGQGIGLILQLKDGSNCWFFSDEIDHSFQQHSDFKNTNGNQSNLLNSARFTFPENQNASRSFKLNTSISYLINPLNFIEWLTYVTKDIF